MAQNTISMKKNVEFNAIKVDALDDDANSEFDISHKEDSFSDSDFSS